MKKVLKQVAGVDVAQNELVVTLGKMFDDLSIDLYAHKVFRNTEKGILTLLDWVKKLTDAEVSVRFVMEATGVYHQKFAFYLYAQDYEVSIVLPNKISNYMRTLENKTITDKSCSEAIAQFGLERKLDRWHKPKKIYRSLQQLTRERDQIVMERVMVKNQLHAEQAEAEPNERSIERLNERMRLLNKHEKEIKSDLNEIINNDTILKSEITNICSITGIGELTATIVLAETNGFELIRNKKQLTSYAGLDVKEKQSGTSVKGKPRISKKGNRHLRKAMYLPSLSAIKYDENFRNVYVRIVSRQGIKMKGLVAVQRKLLEMIYVIYKSKNEYRKDYTDLKRSSALSLKDQYATQTGS
ncbi:MAG: IS110 family transposase [Daejeonella sp.]|uniref:IS110 family transposase n=1 Tax=Daejeonella sp. TaxID=2805397 RepID=UPI003C7349E4